MAAAERGPGAEEVAFPSLAWLERLAALMNANRARQEQLGYVDCTLGIEVTDAGPWRGEVGFEAFEATGVRELAPGEAGSADFVLAADLATWRAMLESIAAGGGRPGLEQTLNHLSHRGTPLELRAEDPLQADLYFRYNQSLQEFVNASAAFHTRFPEAGAR